jgi:hypothetical protein
VSLHYIPEITGGVLLSRLGEVHRRWGVRTTSCGESIPDRHATVSHVQAVVHKLRLCALCYPQHHPHGGRNAQH